MDQLNNIYKRIIDEGEVYKNDRTGVGTKGVFGHVERYNLAEGFPLTTTKKVHIRSILHELLWFISGDTNIKYLKDNGVSIWDEWADENGDLNEVYGKQWARYEDTRIVPIGDSDSQKEWINRGFRIEMLDTVKGRMTIQREIDQVAKLVEDIRNEVETGKHGRRHILNAWNVSIIEEAALPPCHVLYQFYVTTDGKLSVMMYQR